MQAVVLVEPERIELMDIPRPVLTEEDHILVSVNACGVCGSDVRYFHGENPWALHTLGHAVENPPNIVLGHEFAGIVTEVRSSKNAHLLGKRVAVQPWRGCGHCRFCRSGRENLCTDTVHLGHGQGWGTMDFYPGAMAEYSLAWGAYVSEIPDRVGFEAAAMADILGVALHTVGRAPVAAHSDVLCVGGGPAGVLTALVALQEGAHRAYVLEKSTLARAVAGRFDSCLPIDPAGTALETLVREKKSGFSAIYDSVGDPELFSKTVAFLEESGSYVNMAVHDRPLSVDAHSIGCERTVTSASNALYAETREAVRMIVDGEIDTEKIITHRTTFERFLEDFALLLRDPKEAFKVVLMI